MTSLLYIKLFASICILLVSLTTGLAPVRRWLEGSHNTSLGLAETFAGGVFLGAAFFHMLPDANRQFTAILGARQYPYANMICALGFTILLFFEKVTLHYAKDKFQNHSHLVPYILLTVLSIHALSEGIALGVNITIANTLIIFIAIIVHKSSESLALAVSLVRSKISLNHIIAIFIFFSLITPLGILAGSITSSTLDHGEKNILEAIFNAFAAGTFLYIATLHHLHHKHIHEDSNYFYEFVALVIGLTIMAVAAIWV